MKIGAKSRYILEVMALLGLETIEGLLSYPSLYRASSCTSERSYLKTLKLLEAHSLIELSDQKIKGEWVGKLTDTGRSIAMKDNDPELLWNTDWDGYWRLFAFDLPKSSGTERKALRTWLLQHRFGGLQGSVWITPRDLSDWSNQLASINIDPSEVAFMQGKFGGTAQDAEYVHRAWNFNSINSFYQDYLDFLGRNPVSTRIRDRFADWFHKETELWRKASSADTYLPRKLWPEDFHENYLGQNALAARQESYALWKTLLSL